MHKRHHTQLLGVLGIAIVLTIAWLLIADYQQDFASVEHITIDSNRAGLLLDKGAMVRLSGVPVGEVRSLSVQPNGTVAIDVALDKGMVSDVPSNVTVAIHATTVFGSKYVDLEVPSTGASSTSISAGAVLNATGVTVEANDVFQNAMNVLTDVHPAELNAALSSVANALNGRGQKLGQFFSGWNTYLKQLNPHMSAIQSDLGLATSVTQSYADAAPALISAANNFSTTSKTLLSYQPQFNALLPAVDKAAQSTGSLLAALEDPLLSFNSQWLPVTSLLKEYSPEYDCLATSLLRHVKAYDRVFGMQNPSEHYFYAATGFLPGMEPYTFAKNAPKYVTGVGPRCYPFGTDTKLLPHINFNDGTAGVYSDASTGKVVQLSKEPLSVYASVVKAWLGQSGANALLGFLGAGGSQ